MDIEDRLIRDCAALFPTHNPNEQTARCVNLVQVLALFTWERTRAVG
jgi:hypothetical protein